MKGFDYCWVGAKLPFFDYCIDTKDKALLHFRLYGMEGRLQDYVLRRNGSLYEKTNPYKPLNITGTYVLENPLIEYTLRFVKGKITRIHYYIKMNPTYFNISKTKSRYMLQSQILDDITAECVRLSQNTLRELLLLRSMPSNPYYMEVLSEMANVNFKNYGELPHARNITLYDLVLLAKAVGGKLNILIDDLRGKRETNIKLDALIERLFIERREREALRSHFVWSMRKLERFFVSVEEMKREENFVSDPRMLKAMRKLQGDVEQHALAYRKAQKRLPVL